MKRIILSAVVALSCNSILKATSTDKIIAFYQIQDYESALKLIEKEESKDLINLKLEILSKLGLTQSALAQINAIPGLFDLNKKENFLTLESLAWSILLNQKSSSEPIQIASQVGAYLTRDAKAATLLKKNLTSSNSRLRAMAASFAAHFQDPFLKEAVFQRLKEEKNFEVKKELVSTAGKMKMKEIKPILESILLSSTASDELKAQALISFTEIYDKISLQQIQFFLNSDRFYFKKVGLRLLTGYEKFNDEIFSEILRALDDASSEVVQEALILIGLCSNDIEFSESIKSKILKLCSHSHPYVNLFSLWAHSRIYKTVHPKLEEFLDHSKEEIRSLTACLISCLGDESESILNFGLKHKDCFVRINSALGLLQVGKNVKKALDLLEKELTNSTQLWMLDQSTNPAFTMIMPSKVRHHPFIAAFPSVMDGMARLRIIEKMAIYDSKKIKEPIKKLLAQKEAALTFYTMSLLLQEDLENFDELKELVQDKNPSVALAATLALAFIGKDPDIADKLISLFEQVSFEEKLHILEAIGSLGNRKMIPFLVEMMQKPFSSLQIVAASALIQCLYH